MSGTTAFRIGLALVVGGLTLFVLGSLSASLLAALAIGAGILGFLFVTFVPQRFADVRLANRIAGRGDQGDEEPHGTIAEGLTALVERLGIGDWARADLERAGVATALPEFLTRATLVVVLSGTAGAASSGPAGAVVAAAMAVGAIRFWLVRKATRRRELFAEQLPSTLQSLVASLRAGYSLMQAFDAVIEIGAAPTSEEFARLLAEVRIGRDLGDSLRAVSERVSNEDFSWVAVAIELNAEVGGNLSEVLDSVAATIRDREQLRRTVRTLSAEGRVSAWIIFLLPFITIALIMLSTPEYILDFITETVGQIVVVIALFLMAIGGLWLRKIVAVKF